MAGGDVAREYDSMRAGGAAQQSYGFAAQAGSVADEYTTYASNSGHPLSAAGAVSRPRSRGLFSAVRGRSRRDVGLGSLPGGAKAAEDGVGNDSAYLSSSRRTSGLLRGAGKRQMLGGTTASIDSVGLATSQGGLSSTGDLARATLSEHRSKRIAESAVGKSEPRRPSDTATRPGIGMLSGSDPIGPRSGRSGDPYGHPKAQGSADRTSRSRTGTGSGRGGHAAEVGKYTEDDEFNELTRPSRSKGRGSGSRGESRDTLGGTSSRHAARGKSRNSAASLTEGTVAAMGHRASSPRGLVGLRNEGNTCFLNSVLQCLSNVPELTALFLEGRPSINPGSATQGRLAMAYGDLIRSMWSEGSARRPMASAERPSAVKSVVGRVARRFLGFD